MVCTTGNATGANSGNAVFGAVTCGSGSLANAYLYLPSSTLVFLRADAVTTSGTTDAGLPAVTVAKNLAGSSYGDFAPAYNSPSLHASSSINSKPTFQFGYPNTGNVAGGNQDLAPACSATNTCPASYSAGENLQVAYVASLLGGQWDTIGANVGLQTYSSSGILTDNFASSAEKTASTALPNNTPMVVDESSAAGAWSLVANGTTLYTTATNTVSYRTAPRVGSCGGNLATVNRELAEWLWTSALITSGDRTTLVAYHTARYGLAY
jgi:hypothetical protein